ncbi:cytochrome c biogenesis protein CcdA, partial [Stenotrophomonas maltophilia]|nr:cytochrome c biogenesis protein CcdA [Stenotrophomonas maltophilia]
MVSSWILLLVSVAYAALLFGVAWWGDRRPMYPDRPWLRPVVYSLALAVYCSSWTFYGAVGTAVRNGVGYLPIYIGPLLLLLFGWRIIERLALIARSQNVVSIADFISSRFGRSRRLAALVAIIALIGIIPYLALQYKAVAMSLQVLTGNTGPTGFFTDPALYVALLMALFAVALLWPRLADHLLAPFQRVGARLSARADAADAAGRGGAWTSLLIGIATGLLWAPCAGPILGLVLTGAALHGASVGTSTLLLAYALGAVTALALAVWVGGRVFRALQARLGLGDVLRKGLGVAALLAVVAIGLGWDTGLLTRLSTVSTARIEQGLLDAVPGAQPSAPPMMMMAGANAA